MQAWAHVLEAKTRWTIAVSCGILAVYFLSVAAYLWWWIAALGLPRANEQVAVGYTPISTLAAIAFAAMALGMLRSHRNLTKVGLMVLLIGMVAQSCLYFVDMHAPPW